MLTLMLLMALAQDGGSLPPTCGSVFRDQGRVVEGEVELHALRPGRAARLAWRSALADGGFCAPLEPGQWLARATGLAAESADLLSGSSWSATARFTVPSKSAVALTVPREARRTFVVKDSWGRAVMGTLAAFSASHELTTLVWSATLDSRGRAEAALLPDGELEVRVSHGQPQRVHVERRTLGPADATVTLVVERPRSVSFRATGPDGRARDAVTVDGLPASCISGLCRVEVEPTASSLLIEDAQGAAAFVRLPASPVDVTLAPVKLTANRETKLEVTGRDGGVLDVDVEVQPVTRPRWRLTRATVMLPSKEREVLVRPAARRGALFPETRLPVNADTLTLALPTAGFVKVSEAPRGAELWVLPADTKLAAARVEPRPSQGAGPLPSGRYTMGGWARGQPLGPTEVEVEPGVTTQVSLAPARPAKLTIRNERHDVTQPTQVVVLPKAGAKLPEDLADVRAVTGAFDVGSQAHTVTLAAAPGPVTIVVLWQREHQPLRAVSMQTVLTEGENEVRLDDTRQQQNLGPLTEALRSLLAQPFVTTIEP